MKRVLYFFVLMIFLSGCASIQLKDEQKKSVEKQTKEVFGETADYLIVLIPSRGGLADGVFITQSVTQGPSALAFDLAQNFNAAKTKETIITVAGPNTAKNVQVIKDAFILTRSQLPYLQLLFFGTPEQSRQVEMIAQKYGAKYYFREAK